MTETFREPAPLDAPAPSPASPIAERQRQVSLDVLRGFALLGILVMNIQTFAMPSAAYLNPLAWGDLSGGNYYVWLASHLLADQKFMTLFSLLFGCGIEIMARRQEDRGQSPAPLHYRRMGWLLLFGLLHAYLLWYGDILVSYALCGMLLFPLRKLAVPTLIGLGTAMLCVAAGFWWLAGESMPHWPPEEVAQLEQQSWAPPDETLQEEVAAYRGSWLEQLPHRAEQAFFFQTFLFLARTFWRAGGLMLLGMALYRSGFLAGERSPGGYLWVGALSVLSGVALSGYGVARNFAAEWSIEYSFFQGSQFNYWGSLLTSLGYASLALAACSASWGRRLLSPLAPVGRMALTNYLLQTVLCTLIFYGHGGGQFGRFSRVEQLAVVVVIWVVQTAGSWWWLRRYRFGPAEWLWRTLTYRRRQPLRRKEVEGERQAAVSGDA